MNCLLINLERQPERLAHMDKEFAQLELSYQRVEAIDCKNLSPDLVSQYYDKEAALVEERELTLGEIACALSHMKCWQKIIDDDLPSAFIFEDDAIFMSEAKSVFKQVQALSDNGQLDNSSVILFSHTRHFAKANLKHKLTPTTSLYKSYGNPMWGYAYFITKDAASALLNSVKKKRIYFPVDHWWIWDNEGIIQLHNVIPFCARHNLKLDSNLEVERSTFRKNKKKKPLNLRMKRMLNKMAFQVILRYVWGIKTQKDPFRKKKW